MTTITKSKKGEVLTTTDTGYHADGTGPRDASGALLTSREPEGLTSASVSEMKKDILGNAKDDTTTTAADSSAATTPER